MYGIFKLFKNLLYCLAFLCHLVFYALRSGATEILRHGFVPYYGRGLRGAGVSHEMDSHARSCKGEQQSTDTGYKSEAMTL